MKQKQITTEEAIAITSQWLVEFFLKGENKENKGKNRENNGKVLENKNNKKF